MTTYNNSKVTDSELTFFADEIYLVNVSKGFWGNDPRDRNLGEALALCHAELSEAWEGFLTGKADKKLPHYSELHVEIADTLIRCLDIHRFLKSSVYVAIPYDNSDILLRSAKWSQAKSECEILIGYHALLSRALEEMRDGDDVKLAYWLNVLISEILKDFSEVNIFQIAKEKVGFNKTRPHMHGRKF
jgi:hypothetical protein